MGLPSFGVALKIREFYAKYLPIGDQRRGPFPSLLLENNLVIIVVFNGFLS
jgi:hypothetical protein